MFGVFLSCLLNSFHMTGFLIAVYMLTHILPSLFPLHIWLLDFWDYLIGPQLYFFCYIFCIQVFWCGLCDCTGLHFLAACHISVTCFCKGSAYYFSVFDLHLQSYLFQFCCIFFVCLRSFITIIFIETFTQTISYLFNKIKYVYLSPTMPHPFFSNCLSEPVIYPVACISFSVMHDESDGKILSLFFMFFMGCFSVFSVLGTDFLSFSCLCYSYNQWSVAKCFLVSLQRIF